MGGEGGQPSCSWTQHHFDFSSVHASFVSQLKATQAGQLCGQIFWFLVLVQSTLPWHRPAEFEFRGHMGKWYSWDFDCSDFSRTF